MPKHDFIIHDPQTKEPLDHKTSRGRDHVFVDDEIILPLLPKLRIIKTYFHTYDRPEMGLAYCGITIIPYASLPAFLDALQCDKANARNEEINALMHLVWRAIEQCASIVHFGI